MFSPIRKLTVTYAVLIVQKIVLSQNIMVIGEKYLESVCGSSDLPACSKLWFRVKLRIFLFG